MKILIIYLLFISFLFGCVTKKQIKIETTSTTTTSTTIFVEQKAEEVDEKDILSIFYKLVGFIKSRDIDGIISCYSEESTFLYDKSTNEKLLCYNDNKSVSGRESIAKQYKYMFKKRILDNIEFEVYQIDRDAKNPMIKFINAWQNSDYDVEERIFFVKENGKYKISNHLIGKKNDE
ncbi:MAG TPA: hypothetical protein PK771_13040 [Spirochaetota bacterium]|nr:hypothetical protein [Spirochaetota bacterium]